MNVEEITKKLEEIRAEAFDRASSHDEQSQVQLEDYNRVESDEDVAGEDVKLERTKGKDSPTPKTLSRTTSMDGGKRPKEDIYVNDATLKAPSIDELQSKLDSLKKNEINKGRKKRGGQSENPDSPLSIERRETVNLKDNYEGMEKIRAMIKNLIEDREWFKKELPSHTNPVKLINEITAMLRYQLDGYRMQNMGLESNKPGTYIDDPYL